MLEKAVALMLARGTLSVCLLKLETTFRHSTIYQNECRSQWLRGLRRTFTGARQLRLWVRTPPGAWMFVGVSVVCCEIEAPASI